MSDRVVDLIAAAREAGDPGLLTRAIPYARFLQVSAELRDGQLLGIMRYHDELIGNTALPALHGGTLGALMESTAVVQVLWEAETIVLPRTINITVEYLRSGRPQDTVARATITRLGRRVANVRVEAWQDDPDRPIAAAVAHFLIVPADDPA